MSTAHVPRAKSKRTPLPRIGRRSAGLRMTGREFDAIDRFDACCYYELYRGILVVNPIPLADERGPNDVLGFLLQLYRYQHPLGHHYDDSLFEQYVYLTENDRRRADRVIWAGLGRTPDPAVDRPTIVVEFVSRSRSDWLRDYEVKRREYIDFGVREYWIIDRFRRTMTVYRPADPGPTEQVVKEGETFQTPLLPGFELPLAQLLEVSDRWAKARRDKRRRPAPE